MPWYEQVMLLLCCLAIIVVLGEFAHTLVRIGGATK